ncbi:MAG: Small Multidrug Resistance protein [Chloroflexota bacterium]
MAWFFLVCSVLGVVLGQFFYKRYSMTQNRFWLIVGLGLFCLAVPCNMIAARDLGIGKVYVGQSLSYVLAPVLGMLFFAEPVARAHWKYFALIMGGILIYAY